MKKSILICLAGLFLASSATFAQMYEAPGTYGGYSFDYGNVAGLSLETPDALTGVSRVSFLGQGGAYSAFHDDRRPVMRGVFAPFALDYAPLFFLESVRADRGSSPVTAGLDAFTGRVNLGYIDPASRMPFSVQASYLSDMRADVNVAGTFRPGGRENVGTAIMAHADVNFMDVDVNRDGFLDEPRRQEVVLGNRWYWLAPSGTQFRFGVNGIYDKRKGGRSDWFEDPWKANLSNAGAGAFLSIDKPLGDDGARKLSLVADYTFQNMNSGFGMTVYNVGEHLGFLDLSFTDASRKAFRYTFGFSGNLDYLDEMFWRVRYSDGSGSQIISDILLGGKYMFNDIGGYGEFTILGGDSFSAVLGLRGDWYNQAGFEFSPRAELNWKPGAGIVVSADAGRGLRYSNPLMDNIGILSSGKDIVGVSSDGITVSRPLEDAWTFGGGIAWHMPFDKSGKTCLSLDYHYVLFSDQLLVDYTAEAIYLYSLKSTEGASSRAGEFHLGFVTEPFKGFTLTLSGRYTDARQTLKNQADDIKPMTSRFKALMNLQYATDKRSWVFDITASVNGPCKVWDFMKTAEGPYASGYTPVYPYISAQVTKAFGILSVHAGVDNLTGFTQTGTVIRYESPWAHDFDAGCIWGPIFGARYYGGVRLSF